MPTIHETLKQLEAQRYRAQKELAGFETAINALRPLVSVPFNSPGKVIAPAVAKPAKTSTMSASGRERIRAAQKARWAKIRAASAAIHVPATAKPVKKHTMSASTKAKIRTAQKARWAKIRASVSRNSK